MSPAPPATLRVVLFADDTVVAESFDVELWRQLHGKLTTSSRDQERDLIRRWQAASLKPAERHLADALLHAVSTARQVPLIAMIGKSRKPIFVAARFLAMYILRETVGLSYPAIGAIFNRHHTSVMSAVGKTSARIDDVLRAEIKTITERAKVR